MNLDRNNYEEFFLMYVDGELNAQQVQAVETFVLANPDLQQELDMLKEAVLSIDTDNDIVFADKSSLYKSIDDNAISTANYQENFLLYVDGELNETNRAAVETFVLQHPTLQNEFTLLKQTKLEPAFIACPNKEDLYKKEERPVVFMWARRLSVAAAVLLFAVMAWLLVPSKKVEGDGGNGFAQNGKQNNNGTTTVTNGNNTASTASVAPSTSGPVNVGIKVVEQPAVEARNVTVSTSTSNNTTANSGRSTVSTQSGAVQQAVKHIPGEEKKVQEIAVQQPVQNNYAVAPVTTKPVTPKEQVIAAKNNNQPSTSIVQTVNTNTAALNVQPAVYRELNTDDDNADNKTVLVGSMEIKKDKINSLLKKAKGFFKKKTDDDDAKSSIASSSRTLR